MWVLASWKVSLLASGTAARAGREKRAQDTSAAWQEGETTLE